MEKSEELRRILERLNAGEDPDAVKQEVRDFLDTVSPAELSHAEQALVDAGLEPTELRDLCSVHLEIVKEALDSMRARLEPGHVLDTLVREHEIILGFLDELDKLNTAVQGMPQCDPTRTEFETLRHIAEHLVETERHHEREEKVLFPELEKLGVTGPPRIMRMEHEELRQRKHRLKDLATGVETADFSQFKRELDETARYIVTALRDHIFKENNILYPTALQMISDTEQWAAMKKECDAIGYCCFTPGDHE